MPSKLMSGRDPFPFPRPENDDDFSKPKKEKTVDAAPINFSKQANPWNRLNATPTLQSSRREAYNYEPLAPNDNLDFVLKSVYDHSIDYMKGKPEVMIQRETLGEDFGRKLKNRVKVEPVVTTQQEHPLKIVDMGKMEDFNSIKLSIESHHTQITNRGFSRKPDGGYFST